MFTIGDVMHVAHSGYKCYGQAEIAYLLRNSQQIMLGSGFKNTKSEYIRNIYRTGTKVIKTFHKNYLFRDNVVNGIISGLYNKDLVPALLGIFFDAERRCGGYVMQNCMVNTNHMDYHTMVPLLCERTRQSGYVFTDFIKTNVGRTMEGKLTLLDLESCDKIKPDSYLQCKHLSYMRFVEDLCSQMKQS
jgi:hypothetical protein